MIGKRKWKNPFRSYGGVSALTIAATLALAVVVNVILNALATRYEWYFYTAEQYSHQIGDALQGYLTEAYEAADADGERVRIRFCDSPDALEADTVYNMVWQTALQYADRYDFIEVDNIDIYWDNDQVARYKYETNERGEFILYKVDDDGAFITDENGDLIPDPNGERRKINSISTSTVIIDYAGEFTVMPMSSFFLLTEDNETVGYNGEEVMGAMIRWVLSEDRPIACFTTNHGELSNVAFYNLLICAGYEVREIDLVREELPEGTELVVVSNPLYDFEQGAEGSGIVTEIEKLKAFLEQGGFLYTALDPYVNGLDHLQALLAEYGLTTADAVVRDPSGAVTPDGYTMMLSYADSAAGTEIADRVGAFNDSRVIISTAAPIVLSDAAGVTTQALLVSSPSAGAYSDGNRLPGEEGPFALAAMGQKTTADGKTGTVFLSSSVYLTATDALRTDQYANSDFLYALFESQTGTPVPLGCTLVMFDTSLLEGLTMGTAHLYAVLLIAVIPGAVLVIGAAVHLRRRYR